MGLGRIVFFLDDMNLPEVDPYGTQNAMGLLRQHLDYGSWYDTQKLTLKQIDDCQYVTALNPSVGSFSIDSRLQRHFTTFAVALPNPTSLLTIYQTFLDGHMTSRYFHPSVAAITSTIIKASLAVHKEVKDDVMLHESPPLPLSLTQTPPPLPLPLTQTPPPLPLSLTQTPPPLPLSLTQVKDDIMLHESAYKARYYNDKHKKENLESGGGLKRMCATYVPSIAPLYRTPL